MTRWRARLAIQSRLFLTVLALGPIPAWAGRTSHLFMDEAQLVTEGDVELEQWLWTEGRIPSQPQRPVTGWVWFGPVVGISSHLELSLPLQLVATPEQAVLDTISLVARYRFFSREKDEGFQPLVRVEYQQPLSQYSSPPVLKVLLVTTYGSLTAVQLAANVGVELGLPFLQSSASGSVSVLGTAALGVSIPLGHEFRIAAELDGQLPLGGTPHPNLGQLFLGPSLEWTRGQIWVTFGTLFGLTNDSNRFLPKVLWGITF